MTTHTHLSSSPRPAVVKAHGAADLLSLVPLLIGCRPRDSVVLVPFAGGRAAGGLRLDLPADELSADETAEIAAEFVGHLARLPREIDRAAVVVYTDDPYRDEQGRVARSAFVQALLRCLAAAEYGLVDALCVGSDGWGQCLDGPFEPHPLSEIEPDRLALPGMEVPQGDQHAGTELPPSNLIEREQVGHELLRLTLRSDDPTLPDLFEDSLAHDPADLSPPVLARLTLALDRPSTRDIALGQWAGDLDEGRAIQRFNVAWSRGERIEFDGPLRLAGEGHEADPDRLRHALEVAKRVASVAPRARRAGPFAASAWLSWALGRSTHAAHFVKLAREIDPHHGLADIIAAMVAQTHLPAWLGSRVSPQASRARRAGQRAAS